MNYFKISLETARNLYHAQNGEVVESKYVRIAGNYVQLFDPSIEQKDRVNILPVYDIIFRNIEDGKLYGVGEGMRLDVENSTSNYAKFYHPFYFPGTNGNPAYLGPYNAYEITDITIRQNTFYHHNVLN